MAKSKIETQPLTPDQAKLVFESTLNVDDFLKTAVSNPGNLNPGDIVKNPLEWAKLAKVLIMKDKPPGFLLDFEKLAAYYNNAFKHASTGNPKPPKILTAGECRKIIIALTRDQWRVATAELKKNAADETAKLAKAEALIILRKYGWTARSSKRMKKAKKVEKPDKKIAGDKSGEPRSTQPVSQETLEPTKQKRTPIGPAQTVGNTGSTSKPMSSPLIEEGISHKELPIATQPAESGKHYYVKGNSDELSEQFLNIGGKRDDVKGEWYFPTAAHQTIARELRDEVNAKKAAALKSKK